MVKKTGKRARAKGATGRRTRRKRPEPEFYKHSPPSSGQESAVEGMAPDEHYRREKARRANRARPPDHPLEQARRAYHALLESDAARARGGRPRKAGTKKLPPAVGAEAPEDSS